MSTINPDQPIPFAVVDLDSPVPYKLRVDTQPSLRDFVVPRLGIRGYAAPPAPASEPRLKVA